MENNGKEPIKTPSDLLLEALEKIKKGRHLKDCTLVAKYLRVCKCLQTIAKDALKAYGR